MYIHLQSNQVLYIKYGSLVVFLCKSQDIKVAWKKKKLLQPTLCLVGYHLEAHTFVVLDKKEKFTADNFWKFLMFFQGNQYHFEHDPIP